MSLSQSRQRKRAAGKRGAAVLEFAVVLPFFLLIVGGTVELCSVTFLKQSMAIAAYEGARVAVNRSGTTDNIEAKVRDILTQRGVSLDGVSIPVTVTPDPSQAEILEPITVRVRAPIANNTVIPFSWLRVFSNNQLECQVVLRKETLTASE